jgi:hypothetical protein
VTARRFAWVLNLDAELELARPGYNPSVKVREQLALHGAGSRAVLGPDDVLLPAAEPPGDGFVGRAWCPTPLAVAAMRAARVAPEPHPDFAVVRRVNHRKFAFDVGGGLEGQRWMTTRAPLEALLAGNERAWLLKRPLAFAGRGQLRVYAFEKITEKEWQWIDASLEDDGIIVEPLVRPLLEVSQHGFVFRDGHHELGRPCVQGVTDRGVFRSVRLVEPGELTAIEEHALAMRATHVAVASREAGYFGPFGIDGYRYAELGSEEAAGFCALGEINARYTMAFVTGFPRHPSTISVDDVAP